MLKLLKAAACIAGFVTPLLASVALADPLSLRLSAPQRAPIALSLAELDAMRQVSVETSTIWTSGVHRFTGVPLWALLERAGAEGGSLRMTALNDYSIEMPIDAVSPDVPLVATRMDGAAMPVRDKGPFWLVFPYDADPAYQTETTYARSIWQLVEITVLP